MKRNWLGLPYATALFDREPGAGGGTGDPAPPPPPPPAPKKIVFDTQEDLDAVITERLERGVRSRMRELGLTGPQDAEELARLRRDSQERERKALEEKNNYEAAKKSIEEAHQLQLKSIQEQLNGTVGILKSERVDNAILGAASELGAHKPPHVVKLLRDRVRLSDDGLYTPTVLDDSGKPMFNNGRPVTVRELVEGFLMAEPTLRKPTGDGGSGAGGGGETSDQNVGDKAQKSEVERLKAALKAAEDDLKSGYSLARVTAITTAKRELAAAEKKAKEAAKK